MGLVGYVTASSNLTNSLLGTATGLRAYAEGRVAVVDGFVHDLTSSVLSLMAPTIAPEFPTGPSAPAVVIPPPPTLDVPVWSAPGFPTAFTDVLVTGDLDIAPFDDDPPTINFGTAPPPFVGQLPDAPAVNFSYDDPTLSVTLPALPNLLSLNVTKFDGLNLPDFVADDPTLTAVEPSIREYVPGTQYTSALLTGLQATLQDRITSGGTGLTQDVENAIWDRGREREARSQADAIGQLEQMESLGYMLPTGAYLDARLRIMTETDYANRGSSREVMIKSAELMLDNVKTALTLSVQLETMLVDYTNNTEQRIFESAKYATEAGIAIYNAKVQAFGAMVEVYRAKVAVYQARIQAETAKVDAYRALIAGEQAKADINRTLVDQYKVQADVALSNIEVYKAEIAGIQTKAEIEKTKVDIFGAQVQGFTAQVNAYTAGVEGFRAGLSAEQTKVEVYKAQVDAFTSRVGANTAIVNARIAAYRGRIDAKSAEYDGYRAAVQGETARVQGIVSIGGVRADAYKSTVEGFSSYNEVLTKQWAAQVDQQARIAEIGVSAAKANAELYISSRSLALEAVKTGATVSAQIGSAALNSFNMSGSVNSSESTSNSASNSGSIATSDSTSTSNSTSYNYNTSI